jgi:nitrous oxidase accessory protein
MKKGIVLLLILLYVVSTISIESPVAKAQTKTLIVPDNYSTITSALGNAADGDTILVRSGSYNEIRLQSNVSVSLIGEGASKTTINLHPPIVNTTIMEVTISGYAPPIEINANNAIISGFTITSTGGNLVIKGNNAWLANNVLAVNVAISGNYETVINNTLNLPSWPILGINLAGSYSKICQNTGNGLIGIGDGSYNNVFNNQVTGEVGGFGTSRTNLFWGNRVTNGIGMSAQTNDLVVNNSVTGCSHGISILNGYDNQVFGNSVNNNHGAGLAKIEGVNNLFYGNYVANNDYGVQIGANGSYYYNGATIIIGNTTFYNNNFVSNGVQVQVLVASPTDYWNYGQQGNYWSDYTGIDSNGDGIGDFTYYVGGNETNHHPQFSEQDYCPLINPFNISAATFQLPSWANVLVPLPPSILSSTFPPQTTSSQPSPQASSNATTPPSPTVPELSLLVVVPLLLCMLAVAVIMRHMLSVTTFKEIFARIIKNYIGIYCDNYGTSPNLRAINRKRQPSGYLK